MQEYEITQQQIGQIVAVVMSQKQHTVQFAV